MGKKSRRKTWSKGPGNQKAGNKCSTPAPVLSLRRLEAQKEAVEARITEMKAKIGRRYDEKMDGAEHDDEHRGGHLALPAGH